MESTHSKAQESIQGTNLPSFGRTEYIYRPYLELIGSASHFGFQFYGDSCLLYTSSLHWKTPGYVQISLDQGAPIRINAFAKNGEPIKILAKTKGVHQVWVYKTTEAQTGPVFIEKITGHGLKALHEPKRPIIEFIGNSITCGAASDESEMKCNQGQYSDHHNAYFAYGPRLARALHMNYFLSSVSGYGIYRDWNSDGPTLPQVYGKTDLLDSSTRYWDFKKYSPEIVSIALGTNDLSEGDHLKKRAPFDSSLFIHGYIQFIRLVRSHYPKAKIILLSSPMVNDKAKTILENCLIQIQNTMRKEFPRNNPLNLYFFKSMKPRGCSSHPSVLDHGILEKELLPVFRKLLK